MQEKPRKHKILRVIVGSQAHGLATPESDFDYRGVFIYKTSDILKLGAPSDQTSWIEGKEDDTSWELSKFLLMATKCNPTVLEVFLAPSPIDDGDAIVDKRYIDELRSLFPYVWNSTDVMNAFIGYGLNQRKKFLDAKDQRPQKYACAYLRTLYQGWELLNTGSFTIRIADTEVGGWLRLWKSGKWKLGEVMEVCAEWEKKVREAYVKNPDKQTNIEPINEFILKVRRENW